MKVILGMMMTGMIASMMLPLAGCGKKSDVIPPPGYRQPARVKPVPPASAAPSDLPVDQSSETKAK